MSHNFKVWSPELTAKLLKFLDNDVYLTSQDIADRLGLTRNAIIGKINRLRRTVGRAKAGDNNMAVIHRMRKKPAAPILPSHSPLFLAAPPKKARVPSVQLKLSRAPSAPAPPPARDEAGKLYGTMTIGQDQCRFPYADCESVNFHYCGNPGFPWCEHHRLICYTPALGSVRKVA